MPYVTYAELMYIFFAGNKLLQRARVFVARAQIAPRAGQPFPTRNTYPVIVANDRTYVCLTAENTYGKCTHAQEFIYTYMY